MQLGQIRPRLRNTMPLGALPVLRSGPGSSPPLVCRPVFEELFILANGDIVCASPDPTGRRVYGNVYRDRIETVWNGPMYREIRDWQLRSEATTWCPVIESHCARRVTRPAEGLEADHPAVRLIELEPISSCNLKCPKCPVTSHFSEFELAERANQSLPLEVMNNVVEQLPELETILFYGFGEPFLHRDAVAFLRDTKTRRPEVFLATSTNALPLTAAKMKAIADGALVNRIVFAIDGVEQSSYNRYRVGGDVTRALRNLGLFVEAVDAAGTRGKIEIVWQYILFQWNDSDAEIEQAQAYANSLGIRMDWLATHSAGASERFTVGSDDYNRLRGSPRGRHGGSGEVRLKSLVENGGIADGVYLARVTSDSPHRLEARTGDTLAIQVRVENRSRKAWTDDRAAWTADSPRQRQYPEPGAFRIGAMLRTGSGKRITEVAGVALPDECRNPGSLSLVALAVPVPVPPGEYQILIDVVEEQVCWFFERGSPALVRRLKVAGE